MNSTSRVRGIARSGVCALALIANACRDRAVSPTGDVGGASSCDAPVSSWLVAGPFPLDTGSLRLDGSDIGDPAGLFAAAGDTIIGAPDTRWRAQASDSLGRVDLYSVFREPKLDDRAAYALTYIVSPEARTIRIAAESDDDVIIWLNGRRVHRHEIGRELRTGADTISLALAPGSNRLLYRVVNRGGGFGLGGRILSASRDPIGDLRVDISTVARDAARRVAPGDTARAPVPRPDVTLGPASMSSQAELNSDTDSASHGAPTTKLDVRLRVCATRWAHPDSKVELTVGGAREPLPAGKVGVPTAVIAHADWAELARGVLAGGAHAALRDDGAKELSYLVLPIDGDALLTLLSRPMQALPWRGTSGSRDVALAPGVDSTTRRSLERISTTLRVPLALGGLTLEAEVAEFGAQSPITVNGSRATPDSLGRAVLCAPCRAGDTIALAIAPRGTWWDPPRVRVRDLGWAEIRDGAQWARYFTGDSTIPVPDSAVQMELLRAALDGSKTAYQSSIRDWLGRIEPASARIRRDTIDLIGHSHIDAAWMWRWREGRDVVRATWATTAKLMAKYPDMRFAASSAQYYEWLAQTDTALLSRIQALAKSGRWDPVGGWWVESDANIPSGESLVRQALYGQRAFIRLFGHPARVAWLPNTFGFPFSLPQILRRSGSDFFVTEEMRWNDTNRWPPGLNTFWWEGVDGSRVFTDMVYAYDHDLVPRRLAKEFVVTRDSSASPRMLTVYGVGDHGGGPTMAMLDRARDLERVPAFPVIRDASPAASLEQMQHSPKGMPVLRDELYLEFHRGTYTTYAAIKRRNREMEALLDAAEAAAAIAPAPYPHDSLRVAWQRVLFNQFHDILPGTSVAKVYDDAAEDYDHAESIARGVLDHSLAAIAAQMDTRPPGSKGIPYLVLNATARARTGIVRIPVSSGDAAHDANGALLASSVQDSMLDVRVPNVPPLGVALIFVTKEFVSPATASASSGDTRVLENEALRAEISVRTGNITRLYDKVSKREALAPEAAGLVLIEDHPQQWDAWNIDDLKGTRAWVDRDVHVDSVVQTPLGAQVTVRRMRDSTRVSERYVLREYPARLDIELTIDWRERNRLLKLAVPLAQHVDFTRAEIPYASIARPTRPVARRDSARFETPMQRWLDASSARFGVAVANDGKYGYSASGDTMFVTLLRSPMRPDPGTTLPPIDRGVQRATLAIVPHAGDWRAAQIMDAALELNEPLLARPVSVHAGRGRSSSWMRVEPSSVSVGSVKRAEDDDRIIVRLVETSGRAVTARLRFTGTVDACETDLLERELPDGYRGQGASLDVPLAPFEIKTVAIKPAGGR